jgi:hypothetical protein
MKKDNDAIPELTEAQKIRLRATVSDMTDMSAGLRAGTASADDVESTLSRLFSCHIDRDTMINAVHVPADAGPYCPALETILRRIPDGWGRWIRHDAGWYPIVVGCDQRLAAIDPDYVVHQVKEKFGTLRYYCTPSGDPTTEMSDTFDDITTEAARVSAITCERCGQPGALHQTRHLVKTQGFAPTTRNLGTYTHPRHRRRDRHRRCRGSGAEPGGRFRRRDLPPDAAARSRRHVVGAVRLA